MEENRLGEGRGHQAQPALAGRAQELPEAGQRDTLREYVARAFTLMVRLTAGEAGELAMRNLLDNPRLRGAAQQFVRSVQELGLHGAARAWRMRDLAVEHVRESRARLYRQRPGNVAVAAQVAAPLLVAPINGALSPAQIDLMREQIDRYQHPIDITGNIQDQGERLRLLAEARNITTRFGYELLRGRVARNRLARCEREAEGREPAVRVGEEA